MQLWALGLALALLLSQFLGQLHAVKHGGPAVTHSAAGVQVADKTQRGDGFLAHLFSSHSSSADCRLYDQLTDGHSMPAVVLLALPVVLPSLAVGIFQGEALARWAALFDARGPPLTF